MRDPSIASVAVLDAREICSGDTGRNGGRIDCTAVQDFGKYRRLFGRESAIRIVRFELVHLQAVKSLVESLDREILRESELREVDAITTIFEDVKVLDFKKMLRDFEDTFPDLKGPWGMIGRDESSMTLVGRAGVAWPYRIWTGIFEYLKSKNPDRFFIETKTPALSLKRESASDYPYMLTTPRGVVRAKHVVHCTEGHAAHLLPLLKGILVPRRGQMTVQNPGHGFPQASDHSWSFIVQGGLDYATQNPHSGEIFVGGGESNGKSHVLGISSDADEDVAALSHQGGVLPATFGVQQWGHELPGKPRIKASWTGILCNSLDHVPLVGLVLSSSWRDLLAAPSLPNGSPPV
ncbi:hypothetical protein LTR41_010967 [Exophiala xenobiotica]|nr:hypothetical protein LTR41_010967 [Exophiala xenobiotica]KAK5551135.1 hypothetical protein LTR46_010888 [Exophiala xenobiotica]